MELRMLGRVDYPATVAAMQRFTEERTDETPDELWICEHPAVYTQGLAGKSDHVLSPGGIPVVANRQLIGGAGNHGHLLVGKGSPHRGNPRPDPRPKGRDYVHEAFEEG